MVVVGGLAIFFYSDVTWSLRCLISTTTRLLVQSLIRITTTHHEALHYWPFWRKTTKDRCGESDDWWIPCTKVHQCGKFFMPWRQHVLLGYLRQSFWSRLSVLAFLHCSVANCMMQSLSLWFDIIWVSSHDKVISGNALADGNHHHSKRDQVCYGIPLLKSMLIHCYQ